MSRWLLLLILSFFQMNSTAIAQEYSGGDRVQQMMDRAQKLVAVDADGCLKSYNKNEIVVCGKFDAYRKHRLPFPELLTDPGKRVRVPIPNGNPEIVQQGRCYVTMTERNCFKGLPIMTIGFGGKGGGVGGPAGKLWRVVDPPSDDRDYVEQARIKALDNNSK